MQKELVKYKQVAEDEEDKYDSESDSPSSFYISNEILIDHNNYEIENSQNSD